MSSYGLAVKFTELMKGVPKEQPWVAKPFGMGRGFKQIYERHKDADEYRSPAQPVSTRLPYNETENSPNVPDDEKIFSLGIPQNNEIGSAWRRAYETRSDASIGVSFRDTGVQTSQKEGSRSRNKRHGKLSVDVDTPVNEEELFKRGVPAGMNFEDYDRIEVKVSDSDIPAPLTSFEESDLSDLILSNISRCGFVKPTPIQQHAIPVIMAGRDVVACAHTGSGKTAAFLLPIIHKLVNDNKRLVLTSRIVEPKALVLVPCRQLCKQMCLEAKRLAYGSSLHIYNLYGGVSINKHRQELLKGCHLLIATPGSLEFFLRKLIVSLHSLKFMVLDETDRMLEEKRSEGVRKALEGIMNHDTMAPAGDCQIVLVSAVLSTRIQSVAKILLNDPVFLVVGNIGACANVQQTFCLMDPRCKRKELLAILKEQEPSSKVIIFVDTCSYTEQVCEFLLCEEINAVYICGRMDQYVREENLHRFIREDCNILVATPGITRGVDIPGITHVIIYDMPATIDEYVSQIGRTGRIGNVGKSTSFYVRDNNKPCNQLLARDLVHVLKNANQEIPEFLKEDAAKPECKHKSGDDCLKAKLKVSPARGGKNRHKREKVRDVSPECNKTSYAAPKTAGGFPAEPHESW